MGSLVEGILKGDRKAIVTFYHTYQSKIIRYLQKKIPKEDVEELTNDIFLDAIDNLPLLKKEENLQAWLYTIAHHKTVDFYRKKKIKSILLSQAPFLEVIASEINQPEFVYEKNKVKESIEKTFHKLSDKYQKILKLHYEENISIKDIANRLQLSFKAAESLLFRARQSFKRTYDQV